jgi:large subunit ribosomal protein L24
MKAKYKPQWRSSSQKRKQNKFRFNAPHHQKGKFLGAALDKELREEHKTRSARVRTGDTVEVMRGTFKGSSGQVESIDIKKSKIYVRGVERIGKGGQKIPLAVAASNVRITQLVKDKKRFKE